MNPLTVAFQNKHTTLAALVIVAAKAVSAQWPHYAPFCNNLVDGAMAYGLLLAGDAKSANHSTNETPAPTAPHVP